MSTRHRVFVSYHHANDQNYKNIFELRFGNSEDILVRGSVEIGDIDPQNNTEYIRQTIRDKYLSTSSVTVVLVGVETWQRKHVDWEISSSLRDTQNNPRSGLLGILLPSYAQKHGQGKYDPHTIPPRLYDNLANGFATLHPWSENPSDVAGWIHDAYLRKARIIPSNARPMFGKNRSGDRWHD